MADPKFILLGGFLGAGKSTTVGKLARHYTNQGLNVAIVTNDQAAELVDTYSLKEQGFEVGEVAGACFCCSFNELTDRVDEFSNSSLPDVIIAEPVGSCTDLVATVIRPLENVYQRPLRITPYGVLLKPSHGLKILSPQSTPNRRGGFSPKAEYIFLKQLEEADFVVINRIDQLNREVIDELREQVGQRFPGKQVLAMSAKTGEGLDQLIDILDGETEVLGSSQATMEVDYDVYAEGEAELGWLNCQAKCSSADQLSMDELLTSLVSELQAKLNQEDAEIAHLKAIGMSDGNYAVANAVSSFTEAELSLASGAMVTALDLVINARVAIPPDALESIVRAELDALKERLASLEIAVESLESFQPGRPVPTHRITS